MQVNNNISFTSVIPIKVIANGVESADPETIRKTCNYIVRSLSGPVKYNTPIVQNAAAKLGTMDPDYNHYLAYTRGYCNQLGGINSDYFKIITDRAGRGYIVTGKEVNRFREVGQEIGSAQKECKNFGLTTSKRLQDAYNKYVELISEVGRNINLRLREVINPFNHTPEGNFMEMNVYVTTRKATRKGVEKVEIKSLDNIDFGIRNNFTKTS